MLPALFAKTAITVFAASSLTNVFPRIDPSPRYSFAGSDTLAAQIQQGAPADVFASADMILPRRLYREGLATKPAVFARNTLVLITPPSNPAHIKSASDLKRHGVKLVIAAAAVPVGGYTLELLKNMKLTSVLANVVSRETDVRQVLAKVELGEADAGFVYSTDARTDPDKVRVLKLPMRAQPKIQYGISVVTASGNKPGARAFVKEILGRRGQSQLLAGGFLPKGR